MKKIGIYVNPERDPSLASAKHTAEALISRGQQVFMDDTYRNKILIDGVLFVSHEDLIKDTDLVIVLGGDGTILKVIGDAAMHNTPVIGINLGHLGFLTQAERDDEEIFDKIVNGEFSVKHFMMLKARVLKSGKLVSEHIALNDIILRGKESRMISLQVEVDGNITNHYLADGIVAASSTGSTAYSLSSGGPIVHQDLDCIILTPVCPHSLKSRCIIVPPDSKVVLRFDSSCSSEAELKADGNFAGYLEDGDLVEIERYETRAPLAILDGHNYFDVIRRKLAD